MVTITDICNTALSYLGKPIITSIDESSEPARQCKMFYTLSKQKLLRDYDWGFCKKVEPLAELSVSHPRWGHVYKYPNKCLRALKVFADVSGDVGEYVFCDFEKNELYELFMANDNNLALGCNIPRAYIEYIYDVDDVAIFPSDFYEALCHMLASNMAVQLTGSMEMKTTEYQLAMGCMQSARVRSAMERKNKLDAPHKYFDSRR